MEYRKLQRMGGGGTAGVSLPKEKLQELGVIDGEDLKNAYARVEHVEGNEFSVKLVD
jgi:antitoxin component of MazEF toxin-antitoxin module